MLAILAMLLAPATLGALVPGAHLNGAVAHGTCSTRYRFTTAAPIAQVAQFYNSEAAAAHVRLLNDSAALFPDYRTLTFVTQPRFLFVLLSRKDGVTSGRVTYHSQVPPGCR